MIPNVLVFLRIRFSLCKDKLHYLILIATEEKIYISMLILFIKLLR